MDLMVISAKIEMIHLAIQIVDFLLDISKLERGRIDSMKVRGKSLNRSFMLLIVNRK